MTSLDYFMGYLAAAVFLIAGVVRINAYRSRPKTLGARAKQLPFGLPYVCMVAVGVVEIASALALLATQGTVVLMAAVMLAGLAVAGGIYHLERRETAVPSVVLFLLALFVIVGRTV